MSLTTDPNTPRFFHFTEFEYHITFSFRFIRALYRRSNSSFQFVPASCGIIIIHSSVLCYSSRKKMERKNVFHEKIRTTTIKKRRLIIKKKFLHWCFILTFSLSLFLLRNVHLIELFTSSHVFFLLLLLSDRIGCDKCKTMVSVATILFFFDNFLSFFYVNLINWNKLNWKAWAIAHCNLAITEKKRENEATW